MKYEDGNSILSNNQHGFRQKKKKSTQNQLLLTVNDVKKFLDRGKLIDTAMLDFTKAFYRVPYRRLIYKLRWKKNNIGRAIFTLISIHGHYCAISQNLFWPPFLKRMFFFYLFIFFFISTMKMYLCSSTLSQILLIKFLGKAVFQILVTWLFSWNENSFFGRQFETKHFLLIYGCFRCIYTWCKITEK